MSESSSTVSYSYSDPGIDLIEDYKPFIADVPILSYAEPFPINSPDSRSEIEINRTKYSLRHSINKKNFNPPLPLADFCLIAKERWEQADSDADDCCCDSSKCNII